MTSVTNFGNSAVQAAFFIGGSAPTQGNVYHVKPYSGNNGNSGVSPEKALKTLAQALAKATANQNDIVYFYSESNTAANTTDYQSTTLDWNKDGVHLVGVGSGVQIGQRSRIAQLSTVKTIENLFTVSANNCLIANIEVFQGVATSTATSPVAATVSGQRNHIVNCQLSGIGDSSMNTAGARSLVLSGSENLFENCYIGLDTVIRSTAAAEIGLTGTPARNIFKDCTINSYTSSTAFLPITVAAGMDRFTQFENCKFICAKNITSAATPAAVFGGSVASINGEIQLINPFTNCTQYTATDESRVVALAHNGAATGHLIGIAQGINVA
jgi:hypothetical protein